uniref:Uncharacterized protein n=1 Tax=Arundo donax TaxID=35708 RepID=A0A0A9GVH7_ARUDO
MDSTVSSRAVRLLIFARVYHFLPNTKSVIRTNLSCIGHCRAIWALDLIHLSLF